MAPVASEDVIPLPITRAVPREIWSGIFRHLRRPIPAPLSRPPRSALRQPDLVAASKVCKLFNTLSNEILYVHILTDDLPRLFCPPTLHSSRRLFAHTRALYIEYREKGEESSYEEVLEFGDDFWGDIGCDQSFLPHRKIVNCEREVIDLNKALYAASGAGVAQAFPRLRTIAVASVYGTDTDDWLNFEIGVESATHIVRCLKRFELFLSSVALRSVCIRDPNGPLCVRSLSFDPNRPAANYILTIHSPPRIDKLPGLPLPLGHNTPTRFTVDHLPAADCAEMIHRVGKLLKSDAQILREERSAKGRGTAEDTPNIEIYLSSSQFRGRFVDLPSTPFVIQLLPPHIPPLKLSADEQRSLVGKLERTAERFLRESCESSGPQDKVVWRTSADTPVCEACGTGPPAD